MTILTVALLSCSIVSAQTRLISGKVTDAKGLAVPGATVKTKTGAGVAADENGNFQINAHTGDVLIISATDFLASSVRVGNGPAVSISLAPKESKLEEVVVTAMGVQRQSRELGYSTSYYLPRHH